MDSGEVRASLPSPALEIRKDVVDDQLGIFVNVPDVRGKIFELVLLQGRLPQGNQDNCTPGQPAGEMPDSQLYHNRDPFPTCLWSSPQGDGQAAREWWDMEA